MLLLAAAFAGFFVFFAIAGGFALRPSLALSLFAAILFYAEFSKPIEAPKRRFSPYSLSVHPKWEKLLSDYKIITGPEEWAEVNATLDAMPEQERGAIRSPMYFSILSESEDHIASLIYENDVRLFRKGIGNHYTVVPFTLPLGAINNHFLDVRLAVRSNAGGYMITMFVPLAWWQAMKDSVPPSETEADNVFGRMEITLGAVSNEEFNPYWMPHDQHRKKGREVQLAHGGWVDTTPSGLRRWVRIERPYVSITHGFL
jgi:hypothetical protein